MRRLTRRQQKTPGIAPGGFAAGLDQPWACLAGVLDLCFATFLWCVVFFEAVLCDDFLAFLGIGFCISVSGIATFKKSEDLRSVLKDVPLDGLLVETDAPYLAPMPHRGKRNEPSFVVNTAVALAALKGVSADELAHATTDNFFRLFTKAARPA